MSHLPSRNGLIARKVCDQVPLHFIGEPLVGSHCGTHSLRVRPTTDAPFTLSATLEQANGVGALGSHPICFGVHVCFIAAPDIRLSLVTARECYTTDADHGA